MPTFSKTQYSYFRIGVVQIKTSVLERHNMLHYKKKIYANAKMFLNVEWSLLGHLIHLVHRFNSSWDGLQTQKEAG